MYKRLIFLIALLVILAVGCASAPGDETTETTVVVETTNHEATQIASGQETAQVILEDAETVRKEAAGTATQLAVDAYIEGLEATIESLSNQPTQTPLIIRFEDQPTSVVSIYTATPTPLVSPNTIPTIALRGSGLRFFVYDDNSLVDNIREDTVDLIRDAYPGAEVVGFWRCLDVLNNGPWSSGVSDHTVDKIQSAGPKCVGDVLLHNPGIPIFGYTKDSNVYGSESQDMIDAGAVLVCEKPDPVCIRNAFEQYFP